MTMMAEKYVRVVMEESQAMMDENPVDLVQVQQLVSRISSSVAILTVMRESTLKIFLRELYTLMFLEPETCPSLILLESQTPMQRSHWEIRFTEPQQLKIPRSPSGTMELI